MINKSLKQLGEMLQTKQISSVELTQTYLDRIAQLNPEMNAFITVDPDKSLAQAKQADAMIEREKLPRSLVFLSLKKIFLWRKVGAPPAHPKCLKTLLAPTTPL